MINCFRKSDNDDVFITSRSKLDATGHFYSDKTFRELFINTVSCINNTSKDNFELTQDVSDSLKSYIKTPTCDEISTFSNFVVQHPYHRNVKKIETPSLYEVQYGCVIEDGTVYISNENRLCEGIPFFNLTEKYENQNTNIEEWIKEIIDERNLSFQGLVFKDNNGNRWRFRSEKFSLVKSLRGNSPSFLVRYVQLYKQNLIKQYLEYYPEDVLFFSVCHANIISLVSHLLNYYQRVHIFKTLSITDVDKMFHPHLYSLHGHYLSNLRSINKRIDSIYIHEYLLNLPWQRLIFLIKKLINLNTNFNAISPNMYN
jgi:hypothetical protein